MLVAARWHIDLRDDAVNSSAGEIKLDGRRGMRHRRKRLLPGFRVMRATPGHDQNVVGNPRCADSHVEKRHQRPRESLAVRPRALPPPPRLALRFALIGADLQTRFLGFRHSFDLNAIFRAGTLAKAPSRSEHPLRCYERSIA